MKSVPAGIFAVKVASKRIRNLTQTVYDALYECERDLNADDEEVKEIYNAVVESIPLLQSCVDRVEILVSKKGKEPHDKRD